jgi:hypothetical protein
MLSHYSVVKLCEEGILIAALPHPFPTVRSGGLFLILIGLTVILSAMVAGSRPMQPAVFVVGTAIAIVVALILLRDRLAYGEQTDAQRRAVFTALGLEGVGVWLVVELVGTSDLRALWLWLFLVVGFHFFLLTVVHGPKMLVLGVLVSLNAVIGLLFTPAPFLAFALIDGCLKTVFGVLMLTDRTTALDRALLPVEARLGPPQQRVPPVEV